MTAKIRRDRDPIWTDDAIQEYADGIENFLEEFRKVLKEGRALASRTAAGFPTDRKLQRSIGEAIQWFFDHSTIYLHLNASEDEFVVQTSGGNNSEFWGPEVHLHMLVSDYADQVKGCAEDMGADYHLDEQALANMRAAMAEMEDAIKAYEARIAVRRSAGGTVA